MLTIRAYDNQCTMKHVVDAITNWLIAEVFQGQIKNRAEKFPKNVAMHEQISNIKREFAKIG